jgi:hypothetical protein
VRPYSILRYSKTCNYQSNKARRSNVKVMHAETDLYDLYLFGDSSRL